jgi:predicted DNA-binding ArsR family transcriptional regulator
MIFLFISMPLKLPIQELSQKIQTGEDSTQNELIISNNFEEALDIQEFYSLPLDKICKIAEQSNQKNAKNYHKLLQNLGINFDLIIQQSLNSIEIPNLKFPEEDLNKKEDPIKNQKKKMKKVTNPLIMKKIFLKHV